MIQVIGQGSDGRWYPINSPHPERGSILKATVTPLIGKPPIPHTREGFHYNSHCNTTAWNTPNSLLRSGKIMVVIDFAYSHGKIPFEPLPTAER